MYPYSSMIFNWIVIQNEIDEEFTILLGFRMDETQVYNPLA